MPGAELTREPALDAALDESKEPDIKHLAVRNIAIIARRELRPQRISEDDGASPA